MKTYHHSIRKVNVETELTQEQLDSLAAAIQEEFDLEQEPLIEGEDTKPVEHWNWTKSIIRKSS